MSRVLGLCLCLCLAPLASARDAPPPESTDSIAQAEIRRLQEIGSARKSDDLITPAGTARLTALRDTAQRLGVQHGALHETRKLNQLLDRQAQYLDVTYEMARLVIRDERNRIMLPPVVTEVLGQAHVSAAGDTLRTANQTFRIEQPPRFVLTVPSWRDYLRLPESLPDAPHESILPKTPAEQGAWAQGIEQGWALGVRGVQDSVKLRIARLTRDYIGMVRYHLLLINGQVSPPRISTVHLPVSGGGDVMSIEDITLKIDVASRLNPNSDQWNPIPQLADFRWLGYPFAEVNFEGAQP